MPFIIKTVIAFALFTIGYAGNILIGELPLEANPPAKARYGSYQSFTAMQKDIYLYVPPSTTTTLPEPVYQHGDCSWLPAMALKAGWQTDQLDKLEEVARREAGCCPNRRGGDIVDKDCIITGVSEYSHRSDTGTLQINSVNFDIKRNPYAPICLQMGICTQEPLLDPYTNLKAGKLLFDYWQKTSGDGWIPWDICNSTKTFK
jgi:hypothetical protein